MKQVCGYKDIKGNFFEKEKDAKISNLQIEYKTLIYNFENLISYSPAYFIDSTIDVILKHPVELRTLINRLAEICKEIEQLKDEPDTDSMFSILNKWWKKW